MQYVNVNMRYVNMQYVNVNMQYVLNANMQYASMQYANIQHAMTTLVLVSSEIIHTTVWIISGIIYGH